MQMPTLTKLCRKNCKEREREVVKKDLLQLCVHPSLHVAEVFSSPGKALFVHRFGVTPGLALDSRTRWDMNDPTQRAKIWSHSQQERSILIVGSSAGPAEDDTHEMDD